MAVVSDVIIRQAVARMATRPLRDQLGLHQLDGPARAERGGGDLELAAGDQAEDLVAQPRHPHVLPRFVPVQAVGQNAGRRCHVLLVLVPGALGVDGGAETARPPGPRSRSRPRQAPVVQQSSMSALSRGW